MTRILNLIGKARFLCSEITERIRLYERSKHIRQPAAMKKFKKKKKPVEKAKEQNANKVENEDIKGETLLMSSVVEDPLGNSRSHEILPHVNNLEGSQLSLPSINKFSSGIKNGEEENKKVEQNKDTEKDDEKPKKKMIIFPSKVYYNPYLRDIKNRSKNRADRKEDNQDDSIDSAERERLKNAIGKLKNKARQVFIFFKKRLELSVLHYIEQKENNEQQN